ncbi:hypothetical protein HPB51_001106 [Rhipicephalus microplus]|uniref:Glycoside hydrolase family 31 TIM barrel domain-containing protein n=1 Tax=Rhipicephalus microplus TaxID=6941 RepID=A0A9J6EUZ9_RHIMP|nr:hypothetical protein HPB51_001106 [Rhipicephalus microplus]
MSRVTRFSRLRSGRQLEPEKMASPTFTYFPGRAGEAKKGLQESSLELLASIPEESSLSPSSGNLHRSLRGPLLCALVSLLLSATVLASCAVLAYVELFYRWSFPLRVDCDLDPTRGGLADYGRCLRRGCKYVSTDSALPTCFFPVDYGYVMVSQERHADGSGFKALLKRPALPPLFGGEFEDVAVNVYFSRLLGFACNYHPIVLEEDNLQRCNENDTGYEVLLGESGRLFGIAVTRKENGAVIFDTRLPGTVLSKQFLQVSTRLTTANIFGLGGLSPKETLKQDINWKTVTFFNKRINGRPSEYFGVHPFYMVVEEDGKANGLFLRNGNAMDVLLQPEKVITFRTTGGLLDFDIFLGDSPDDVLRQFTEDNAFVDFTNPETMMAWTSNLRSLYGTFGFDGLLLDINEPTYPPELSRFSTMCSKNKWNNPLYPVGFQHWGRGMFENSVCGDANQSAGIHYDMHNLYGYHHSKTTWQSLVNLTTERGGERPMILSRATFSGSGSFGGHWFEEEECSWESLRRTIVKAVKFSMLGMPLVGGYCHWSNESEDARLAWHEVTALLPLSIRRMTLAENLEGESINLQRGGDITLNSENVALHVRGGFIIPLLRPVDNRNSSVKELELFISPDENGDASGFLFWDDGITYHADMTKAPTMLLNFTLFKEQNVSTLAISAVKKNSQSQDVLMIQSVTFCNAASPVSVLLDGKTVETSTYDSNLKHPGLGDGLESLDPGGILGLPDGPQFIGKVMAEQSRLPSRLAVRDCHVYRVRRGLLCVTGALPQHVLQRRSGSARLTRVGRINAWVAEAKDHRIRGSCDPPTSFPHRCRSVRDIGTVGRRRSSPCKSSSRGVGSRVARKRRVSVGGGPYEETVVFVADVALVNLENVENLENAL